MTALTLLALSNTGCTTSLHRQALAASDRGDALEAQSLLEEALVESPHSPEINRDLGIICLKRHDLSCAQEHLLAARKIDSDDGATLFYLGILHEESGDENAALEVYRHYVDVSRLSRYRKRMETRFRFLTRKMVEREIRDIVQEGEEGELVDVDPHTIALVPLHVASDSEELRPLGTGLAAWLTTDLAKVRQLTVVERLRMDVLLRELQLAETGLVDPQTAPRIGRLLRAHRIVTGSVQQLSEGRLRTDLLVVDAATAENEHSVDATVSLEEFFRLEKQLVLDLIDAMGIVIGPTEREEILRIPTRDLSAFLAYGRGLELERAGEYEEAQEAFREAVTIDPSFELAEEALRDVASEDSLDPQDEIADATIKEDEGGSHPGDDAQDLLEDLADQVDTDFWSDDAEDRPTDGGPTTEPIPGPPDLPGDPSISGPPDPPAQR